MLKDEILKLPENIKDAESRLIEATRRLYEAKKALEYREQDMFSEICNQADERGNKIFSNDGARKAELSKRMQTDEEYKKIEAVTAAAQIEVEKLKIELNYVSNMFSGCRAIAYMEAAKA